MSLVQELQNIGLSDKEAKVYLAALELGQASVQKIAEKANVNRATTYSVLESLIKKGLCSTFEQEKKVRFIASAPEYLLSLFEVKKKEVEQHESYFRKLLPEIQLIHNQKADKPIVRFFEGQKGLFACMKDFLSSYRENSLEEDRMIYSNDKLDALFSEEDRKIFRSVRLHKEIRSKVIYSSEKKFLTSTRDGRRLRINDKKYPITCDIGIYGDSIRFSSLDSMAAVLIKDVEIAKTLKTLFDLAYERAEQIGEHKVK